MFLQKSKTQMVGKKIMYFSVMSFQEFLIFPICAFFRKCSMFCWSIPLRRKYENGIETIACFNYAFTILTF